MVYIAYPFPFRSVCALGYIPLCIYYIYICVCHIFIYLYIYICKFFFRIWLSHPSFTILPPLAQQPHSSSRAILEVHMTIRMIAAITLDQWGRSSICWEYVWCGWWVAHHGHSKTIRDKDTSGTLTLGTIDGVLISFILALPSIMDFQSVISPHIAVINECNQNSTNNLLEI